MPIRLRLTIWYTSVLAALLLVFSGSLYAAMYYALTSAVDRDVMDRAQEAARMIRVFESRMPDSQWVRLPNVNVFAAPDTFIQVVNTRGQVVARSFNLNDAALPHTAAELAVAGPVTHVIGNSRLRLYNHPLVVDNTQVGTIQAARSLNGVDFALLRLRLMLVFGCLILLAVTAVVTAVVARSVTRPLDQITQAALRIGATPDLAERVRHRGPPDEIGRFATAFNQMLDRLQEAYFRLREAFENQRQFLADLSHQLRTPLTVIRGNMDLLQQAQARRDDETAAAAIADIDAEARRMSRLVDDLLTLARAEAGQRPQKQPVLIGEVLADAVRQARAMAGSRTLNVHVADEVNNSAVLGYAPYLQHLFATLLENAVKFTAPDGHITLTAELQDSTVTVAVADDGIGIPPAEQEQVFERFWRGANARNTSGSGLGLALARWITTDHGGSISLTSQPGTGTCFTVTLPLYTGAATEA